MNDTEWLEVLRQQCRKSSQKRVADRLRQSDGYPSATVINQVLNDKYPSPKNRIMTLVEGVFMNRTVDCPVLGETPVNTCVDAQVRPFSSHNPLRVQLYRACRNGCPHSRIKE